MFQADCDYFCDLDFCRFDYDDANFKVLMEVNNSTVRTKPDYSVTNIIPGALHIAKSLAGVRITDLEPVILSNIGDLWQRVTAILGKIIESCLRMQIFISNLPKPYGFN